VERHHTLFTPEHALGPRASGAARPMTAAISQKAIAREA
jgi:hypothetical protein